jgi:hypothetical protein
VKYLLLLALLGCAHTSPGAVPKRDTALLRVACEPGDATIWIDGRLVAQVRDAQGGVRVIAGTHRLEVRHDRFHTRYFELALRRGEERVVDVQLVEELD